ncbi:TIGR01777 family oxidoreductase [Myroides injenensis]|uniref:TIGR01777 family oxidoreductase n=1 Tax=Myroides injenensis TaxID=1183151 RepID=UPI0002885C28|nr:TIGR01777 family oxidoreductase [Myroides injenensis]
MKVLVTGATGLIGKKIVQQLLDNDVEVNYFTTDRRKIKGVFVGATGYYWNPDKQEIEKEAFTDVKVIVHLAGANISGSWSKSGKESILNSRINSSNFLYTWLEQNSHSVKQIVCASAIGIYADISRIQSESDFEPAKGFLAEVVRKWEEANLRFNTLDINVSLLRIGLVLSDEGGALPHMIKPMKMYLGSVLGSGKQCYSWIHIVDVVNIFEYVIKNQLYGIYNAVGPHPRTNKELTYTLSHVIHRKIWLPPIPSWVLKLFLGEKASLVLDGQRVSSKLIMEKGYCFVFPKLEKAIQNLYLKVK